MNSSWLTCFLVYWFSAATHLNVIRGHAHGDNGQKRRAQENRESWGGRGSLRGQAKPQGIPAPLNGNTVLTVPLSPLQNRTKQVQSRFSPQAATLRLKGETPSLRGFQTILLQVPEEHVKFTNHQIKNTVSSQRYQMNMLMVDKYLQGACTNTIGSQHGTSELNILLTVTCWVTLGRNVTSLSLSVPI